MILRDKIADITNRSLLKYHLSFNITTTIVKDANKNGLSQLIFQIYRLK